LVKGDSHEDKGTCSFICQDINNFDQETVKRPFRTASQATTCYYQSNHSNVEATPLSACPKDTTSEISSLSSYYTSLMLNVKQGSCE